MCWAKRKEFVPGTVTLVVCLEEGKPNYESVIQEFSHGDFTRVVIASGVFTNLGILAPCAGRLNSLMLQSVTTSLVGIENLSELQEFNCDVDTEKPLADFSKLLNLRQCVLAWSKKYDAKNYSCGIFKLPLLSHLTLRHWTRGDCADIGELNQLEYLRLRQGALASLNGLEKSKTLKSIHLSHLSKLTDIAVIARISNLEHVHIEVCSKIADLSPLADIKNLRNLSVEKVGTSLTDLRGIASLRHLEKLVLSVDIASVDWEVLFNHPTLREVDISTHEGYCIPDSEILRIAESANRKVVNFWRRGTKQKPSFAFNLN